MTYADRVPHRRDDGELLGWIRPEGEGWAALDVLGRPVSAAVEWLDAEAALEEHGIGWLADVWMLEVEDGRPLRVRIVEVTPDDGDVPGCIVVKAEDFGDVSRPSAQRFVLSWPLPGTLRPPRDGDPDPYTLSR